MESKRLDVLLTEEFGFSSRTKAVEAIKNGDITVNGFAVMKPSYLCGETDLISVLNRFPYVGRGALKLIGALDSFALDVSDKNVLDIGSSTGGFTQVFLERKVRSVIAVDVGSNQMADILRNDSRVRLFENTDIRSVSGEMVEGVSFFASDVSFISLTMILDTPSIRKIVSDGGEGVVLIKPQFEAGRSALDKHGVVKGKKDILAAVEKVVTYAESLRYPLSGLITSPIKGGDGNTEFLLHIGGTGKMPEITGFINKLSL